MTRTRLFPAVDGRILGFSTATRTMTAAADQCRIGPYLAAPKPQFLLLPL
jgi:hypothetical protein